MHPHLHIVFSYLLIFCGREDLPCVVTSIMEDAPGRKYDTHKEGRAIDISIRGWKHETIHQCIRYLDFMAGHLAAISAKDLKKRLVIHETIENSGNPEHLHIQVHP